MICYICQRDLKTKKVYRGVQECETIDCKNMIGIGYRACSVCSEELSECEVCRGDLRAIEVKRLRGN